MNTTHCVYINNMYNARIMNSEALINDLVPKPKINRLPFLPNCEQDTISINQRQGNDVANISHTKQKLALLTAVLVTAALSSYWYVTHSENKITVPDDDAALISLIEASGEREISRDNSSFHLRDNGNSIIGQMVKISPETKVVTNKENDSSNASKQELLDILDKN